MQEGSKVHIDPTNNTPNPKNINKPKRWTKTEFLQSAVHIETTVYDNILREEQKPMKIGYGILPLILPVPVPGLPNSGLV